MNNFFPFIPGINGDDPCPPEDYDPSDESFTPMSFPENQQKSSFFTEKDPNIAKNNEKLISGTKNSLKWNKNPKFLAIKGISKENLLNKTGQIVKGDPLKKEQTKGVGFGKYKDKTKDWIRNNDPAYFSWASENVKGF